MKITFLVNHDLPSLLAFHYLTPSLDRHQVTVFYTRKSTQPTAQQLAALSVFETEKRATAPSLRSFEEIGASLLNDINNTDYQRFAQTKPDLVISIRHMSILKSKAISTPSLGVINLHSGLLPAYQGVMATFWALLNKEQQIGTSLHFIENSQIDTGSIISQSVTTANYRRSYFFNVLNIYRAGCENILQAIKTLDSGNALSSEPQSAKGQYFSFPTAEDINSCDFTLFDQSDSVDPFV